MIFHHLDDKFTFGKYSSHDLGFVLMHDPEYIKEIHTLLNLRILRMKLKMMQHLTNMNVTPTIIIQDHTRKMKWGIVTMI